jgi:SAM-dependent methyltransferase
VCCWPPCSPAPNTPWSAGWTRRRTCAAWPLAAPPAAQLWIGQAAETGLADAAVDHIVSVNTVAIWPDLEAGLAELARVLRPGGHLLLGWHSPTARSSIARRMALSPDQLARIETGLAERFSSTNQTTLSDILIFHAQH